MTTVGVVTPHAERELPMNIPSYAYQVQGLTGNGT